MSASTHRRYAVQSADAQWFANNPGRLFRIRPAMADEMRAVTWPLGTAPPTEGYVSIGIPLSKLLFAARDEYKTEPDEAESQRMFQRCLAATEEDGEW